MNFFFLIKMAWRDSRRSRSRLLLFTSSIVLGIAALVAINSFSENLRNDIEGEAKTLLGADLRIESRRSFSDSTLLMLKNLGGEQSIETNFSSMVLFPKTGGTRLLQVKALEGDFPYYGKIGAEPPEAVAAFRKGEQVLVDKNVFEQFGAEIGDTIKVGQKSFIIGGKLTSVPGRASFISSVAPVVMIPRQYMDATGLVQKGSRTESRFYYKFGENMDTRVIAESIEPYAKKNRLRIETISSSRDNVSEAFGNMNSFLNLVGFIALLLGCIGVASAVHSYMKEKLATVAILRCLGASGKQAFVIYLIQIAAMGLIGSIVGAFLGSAVQQVFPLIWQDFLPFEVNLAISWTSIIQGIGLGLGISILFALLPLLSIRLVSPLNAIRWIHDSTRKVDPLRWLVFCLILLFVVGFAYWQIRRWMEAIAFTLFILISFLLLALVARILMWAVKRFFPSSWSYLWRQSLANLYRPNNQTLILLVSIGLGTMLIGFLYFTQGLLLGQLQMVDRGEQPNMIVFDIQDSQRQGVRDVAKTFNLPVKQEVPIVTMRIAEINGKSRKEIEADSTINLPGWAFNRENRVTFRDSLIEAEELVGGVWTGEGGEGIVPISLEEGYARAMRLGIGDKITFNVQGVMLETEIGSLRKVSWNRLQTNFFVLFPSGVLEDAPKMHVTMLKSSSVDQLNGYKQALVSKYPNISVIDLTSILDTIDDIFGKVSFVIAFMALFSIATGIMVLIGSVIISKFQRVRESVLLRTLGANRKQILIITALEYAFLGFLAALTGIFLALLGAVISSQLLFQMAFVPRALPIIMIIVSITLLTVLIGLSNVRGILNRSPLEVLRGAG